MESIKDQKLKIIWAKAEQEARHLAGEFARTTSEERESLLTALELEQWLAQSCAQYLE